MSLELLNQFRVDAESYVERCKAVHQEYERRRCADGPRCADHFAQ